MPTNFNTLPAEIREHIVNIFAQEYVPAIDPSSAHPPEFSLAPYTTVCKEWAYVLERATFRSLCIDLHKMAEFARCVTGNRRRRLRHVMLQVLLDGYSHRQARTEEAWFEKIRNNKRFSETLTGFFEIMHTWVDEDVVPGGIRLELAVSSVSDLRNLPRLHWERRRVNWLDIGDRRFQNSAVDFFGQDNEGRKAGLLKPVYAISSFHAGPVGLRTVVPAVYGEIISALPRLRDACLTLPKPARLDLRKQHFTRKTRWLV